MLSSFSMEALRFAPSCRYSLVLYVSSTLMSPPQLVEDVGVAARVLVEQAGAALLLVLKRQVVHVFAARGQCGWRADVGAVTFRHPGREKLIDLSANAGHGEDI